MLIGRFFSHEKMLYEVNLHEKASKLASHMARPIDYVSAKPESNWTDCRGTTTVGARPPRIQRSLCAPTRRASAKKNKFSL